MKKKKTKTKTKQKQKQNKNKNKQTNKQTTHLRIFRKSKLTNKMFNNSNFFFSQNNI